MDKETLYFSLLQNLPMGAYYVDQNRKICFWNRAAEQITGYSAEDVEGLRCQSTPLSHIDLSGKPLCCVGCPLYATLADGKHRQERVFVHHKKGHPVLVNLNIFPILEDGRIAGAVEYFTPDTTQIFEDDIVGKLSSAAMQDALTHLPNRRYLESFLQYNLTENRRHTSPFAVLFADVDDFSKINNTYGHGAGDAVLTSVAEAMRQNIARCDLAGRWGGEEFLGVYHISSPDDCVKIAEDFCNKVRHTSIHFHDQVISTTISIGITAVRPGDSMESIVERADHLMYKAKESGKDQIAYTE